MIGREVGSRGVASSGQIFPPRTPDIHLDLSPMFYALAHPPAPLLGPSLMLSSC
jgi:hypothetical protein